MGTIASVLQWTCTNCNLINPTECLKCLQCGNVRQILEGGGGGGGGTTLKGDAPSGTIDDGDAVPTDGRHRDNARVERSPSALNNNDDDEDIASRTNQHQLASSSIDGGRSSGGGGGVFAAGANKASTIGESAVVSGAAARAQRTKTLPGYVEISSNG